VRALAEAYPDLEQKDYTVVARFIDPASGKSVIDVMKPAQEVFRLVFRHTIAIGDTHDIPTLEMALVSKFAAMVSPRREPERKLTDGGDFMDIVKSNRSAIDVRKLQQLAEKVYPGGGAEIKEMIEDIDSGRIIRL